MPAATSRCLWLRAGPFAPRLVRAENSLKALRKEADERLLVEAAQKDPARFAELYENNFERVYAYVVRRVGDRAETEDLTSEVFHHALSNLKRFEWRGIPFAAWLVPVSAKLIFGPRPPRRRQEVGGGTGQNQTPPAQGGGFSERERR